MSVSLQSFNRANMPSQEPLPMVAAERERNIDNLTPILNLLSHTPFKCLGAEQLTGGALNFTFRGRLASPLSDGSQSVIIKYSKDYVLCGTVDTTIPASRCVSISEVRIFSNIADHDICRETSIGFLRDCQAISFRHIMIGSLLNRLVHIRSSRRMVFK